MICLSKLFLHNISTFTSLASVKFAFSNSTFFLIVKYLDKTSYLLYLRR